MGQDLSCGRLNLDHQFFKAMETGDLEMVESALRRDPEILNKTTLYCRLSLLHIAVANGRLEVLSAILDRSVHPDLLNRHKQRCRGRSPVCKSFFKLAQMGFARFVNIRDGDGATPLHLAARQGRADCLHILLDNGALVSASTGGYSYPGSTPLHLAARGGYLDCVRELLAWGADRKQRDSSGLMVIFSKNYLFLVVSGLDNFPLGDAKALLEAALMDANREREKNIWKGTAYSLPSPVRSEGEIDDDDASEAGGMELCCICFNQICTIEVQDCGHQMCAHCTLALCCHSKPNPATSCLPAPVCPFCRSIIAQLVVARTKTREEDKDNSSKPRKSRKSQNSSSEGSSSLKGLSSAMGSLGKMGSRGSGRIADSCGMMDKPWAVLHP
ncbi:E3 ubiquitin-protein ligase XB3 [Cocos nucifera]|uniref:RING-type E3 ubiquitin transferase n=1 Tax=Cocos nucifera TaxID=13894 RepID=A0A8K0ISH7_COCNU|nr:E3 ubiquitin-protein ligase XB3 [Cocos nucifera]